MSDPASTPALEVRDLVKVYAEGVRAVDGVSFSIAPGEVFALLGPNGAGKSTTIRVVATLLRPTSGAVRVLGHDVVADPDAARAVIGYVPQEVALDRHLTSRQHLVLSARLYHVASADLAPRVDAVLRLVELADRADEPVKRFSGGMKKRLDLACGLLHRPRLLILDEPTVGLDIQTRHRIWSFVADLRAQGTAVLLTTHDMEEADELADRIAVVDHGKVQVLGTSAELKTGFGGEMVKVDLGRTALAPAALEALRTLPDVRAVEQRGRALLFTTGSARALAPQVAEAVEKQGLGVRGLSFGPPTLDDVFLKITGHAIRDEA
jgi:ABC-2 type transport system ATP-binding protein